ncbi:MAG: DUF4115 domain-containing protein [Chromatiaceae bacterium]|nr:DUF4115 domain-containing protein [Gammaproteobacteria bacterium]MCP5301187.1 DUF4115 domain-containing protein [Chromatiaceae bacterium]MCP5421341.1 DUF4115 domain-containing protein [Chromatiaceae bacterium]
MSDQSTSNVAEFFSPGPGERLRAARLSMGYDLAKIASELHLTTPVVEALEADDFSGIGARVFVRGYLRNYARIVGMPVESILRQFDEKWPDDGGHQTMLRQTPTLPADVGPGRGVAGAITWLLLIGVVALFLVWWRGYLDGIVPEGMRSSTVVAGDRGSEPALEPVSDSAGATANDESPPADGSLRLPAPPSDLPVEDVASGVPGDEPVGPDVETTTGMTETAAASAETGPSEPLAAVGTENGAPLAAAATAASADEQPAAEQGGKQIVLNFSGACWVDVRDNDRKFKLFGEMPKGTRKVLGGQPPYKVVIGNAKAVDISVDGKPFDLAPYAKGNVARFTLDP